MYSFEVRARAAPVHGTTKATTESVPKVVYWIGLSSLLADICAESVASVLPIFLFAALQLSPLQVGFMDGLYQGGAAVVRVLAAFVADRHQANRGVAMLGYALSALSRIGFLLSGSLGLLVAMSSLCLDRIGKGIRTAPRDALIAAHTPKRMIGAAFGVHRSMDAVGALVGPLLSAGILWLLPFRFDWLFAISLAFGVAGVLVFRSKVSNPAQATAPTGESGITGGPPAQRLSMRSTARLLLADKRFVGLTLLAAFLSTFTVSDGLIYVSLQRSAGFNATYVPLMFAFTAIFFFIAAVPLGRAADRVGPVAIFLVGYAVLSLLYLWLAFLPSTSGLSIAAIVALLGVHYAATDGVLAASAVRSLDPTVRTTGLAVLATAVGLTRIGSSVLYGWLWQQTGQSSAIQVFAVGMTVCLFLSIWALRSRRRS